MEKKSQLSEELARHLSIVNYTNRLDEALQVTFQEQEPEVEPGDEEAPTPPGPPTGPPTPPTGAAGMPTPPTGPPTPGGPKPPTPGGPPAPGGTPTPTGPPTPPTPGGTPPPLPPPPPPPAEMEDEEVEEIDVTDLVNNQEEVGSSVEKFATQLSDIESKFSDLAIQLDKMDMIFQKIDSMEDEIQKMAPMTPVEKMELRSLDSFPYNQRLDSYFEDKKAEYKKLRGIDLDIGPTDEKEYTLTQGEANEWDDNEIGNSFNPDFSDKINEGKLVWTGENLTGGCVCVYAMADGSYDHTTEQGCICGEINQNGEDPNNDQNMCCASTNSSGGQLVSAQPLHAPKDIQHSTQMGSPNSITDTLSVKGAARKGMRVSSTMK